MASGGQLSDAELDELVAKLKMYADLTNKPNLTSQAVGKITKDNLLWKELRTDMDSSVFPTCKDDKTKPYMTINKDKAAKFLSKSAEKLEAKKKGKKPPSGSWEKELLINLKETKLSKTTKTSATGSVDAMTDTSKYTGMHANKFDKDGKGLGGADAKVENTGYVGAYKGQNSYDKK